jgi:hypothetical protein
VAVIAADGNRFKCVRLRWGGLPNGWADERAEGGKGDTILEKLDRAEWSSTTFNDTAIAARVALIKEGAGFAATVKSMNDSPTGRVPGLYTDESYWTEPLTNFLDGKPADVSDARRSYEPASRLSDPEPQNVLGRAASWQHHEAAGARDGARAMGAMAPMATPRGAKV